MAPIKKYFGNINLGGLKKAVSEIPAKVDDYKGEKQLKVSAAMWEDGGISIDIWNGDTKESIKLGNLRVSSFDDDGASAAPAEDLPF